MAKRVQGYATVHIDGQLVEEEDTFTCGHCNGIVPIKPGQTDTDSCRACDSHICQRCAHILVKTMKCVTVDARLEAAEREARLRRNGIS